MPDVLYEMLLTSVQSNFMFDHNVCHLQSSGTGAKQKRPESGEANKSGTVSMLTTSSSSLCIS